MGTKYFLHFGEEPASGTIWKIPGRNDKLLDRYREGLRTIAEMSPSDIDLISDKQRAYVKNWQENQTAIDSDSISEVLKSLERPLYFYDYETISSPIPLLENSYANQLVVVQYSLHILDENDQIVAHHECIVNPDNGYSEILAHLMSHTKGEKGTFVVWNKSFENTRNKEMAVLFSEHAEQLLGINDRTFDLMEIFRDQLYFDRDFNGSASIKKILPVLTDLSHAELEVTNGGDASELLLRMVKGELGEDEIGQVRKNLFAYCRMDTLAMVRIYERLVREVSG